MRGRLISLEGLDGTGKTTVCDLLERRLIDAGLTPLRLREPGGTAVGEEIRGLLADPSRELDPVTELLLFSAARAELVRTVVTPALADGRWVLLDRFVDSTLAYQGAGRQLGDAAARAATDLATGGVQPDRTLLLMAPAELRAARIGVRGEAADRLERAGDAMFARTEARYEQLARDEPARVRLIDATGTPEAVAALGWAQLRDLLPATVAADDG